MHKVLRVSGRQSPLSRAQIKEVLAELQRFHPHVAFETYLVETHGDKDQQTSLRTLEKTDFFTREVDALVLNGTCQIAIHSAKDLPDPIPNGLQVIAITSGLDPSDSLVLRPGVTLRDLPAGAVIATSSERREEAVRQLRADLQFIDIRGTITQRLAKLDAGQADGVVIAEAALIRLGLTHLNRIRLPSTVPYQGQLAIITRVNDDAMKQLFACIDSRPTALYLGLTPPQTIAKAIIHYPIIRIIPAPAKLPDAIFTHLIFTSKTAVELFAEHFPHLKDLFGIAVGKATASRMKQHGICVECIASDETAEGIVCELKTLDLKNAHVLWPHAAGSRRVISDFLKESHIQFHECILYHTEAQVPFPLPDLNRVDEIVFTSPSTVSAFLALVGQLPTNKKLSAIGPITYNFLKLYTS